MAFKLKTKNHLYSRSLDKNSSVFLRHEAGHEETTTTTSGEWSDWVQDPNNPKRYTRNRTNTTTSTTAGRGKGGSGVSYEESYKNADKSRFPSLSDWKKYVDDYNKGSSSTTSNVETQEKFVTPEVPTIDPITPQLLPIDPGGDPIKANINYKKFKNRITTYRERKERQRKYNRPINRFGRFIRDIEFPSLGKLIRRRKQRRRGAVGGRRGGGVLSSCIYRN